MKTDNKDIKVLLVEDNPDHADIFRDMLSGAENFSSHLEVADRLSTALECLSKGGIDVLLLDLSLPDCQGMETFAKIQTQFSSIPIVILSALADETTAVKAVQAGAQDYLFKGKINATLLERSIRYAIERKRAEKTLRQERDNLFGILNSMKDGVYIVNQQYVIEYLNPVLQREFGLPEGRKCYEYFHDLKEACSWCKNQDVFAGKTVHWEWYSAKNNKTYDIIDTPMQNPDGSMSKLEIFRDITERRQAEDEKEKLEAQIRQSQKMEAIGTLASGMAHNFNNILCGIMGYLSFIKNLIPHEGEVYEYVDKIEMSAKRAAILIRKLLEFARGGNYIVHPVECTRIIRSTLSLLENSLDKNIVVEDICRCEGFAIMGDERQIEQALLNLCLNAKDAMAQGGKLQIIGEIKKFENPYPIREGNVSPGTYLVLQVVDTGAGMTEEIINHIYEPFFSSGDFGEKIGLGLAMVYSTMKNHGGYIDIKSEVGVGSNFTLYFPVVEIEPKTLPT